MALPIYLRYWSAAQYGTWLLLSAIPAYFTMADVGMLTAAGNKMTMDIGRGDFENANRTFQSAFVFMLLTCMIFFALTVCAAVFLHFPAFDNAAYKLSLVLLIAAVLLAFFNGLAEAVFRSTGRYGVGTTLGQSIRLAEWIGGLVGLYTVGSFVAVALGMLIARALGVGLAIVYAIFSTPRLRWGFGRASKAEVRSMFKPAAMFMMFPVVNALSFQGFTLLVGGIFGAVDVAIFSTYRTLARVTVQATSTLSTAIGPEMSRLYGAANLADLRSLYRRANGFSALIAFALPALIAIRAPFLIAQWTHGRIPYIPSMLLAMLLYAAVSGLWHVPRVLLLSINRHSSMATFSLIMAVAALGVAWAIGKRFSLDAVVWVLVASEFIMAIAVHRWARQILGDAGSHTTHAQETTLSS